MDAESKHRSDVEARFAEVFAHLGLLSAYARRRGACDPDAIAAEAMAIAWRPLADVSRGRPASGCDRPAPFAWFQIQTLDGSGRVLVTDDRDAGM